MKLEELAPGTVVDGLVAASRAEVVMVSWYGTDTVKVLYRTEGGVDERLLSRADEDRLSPARGERPWKLDAPGHDFKLASEARRIRLAHLFDPYLAVQTADIRPLPHQIEAVYERMLPRQPLRFLLADDPGSGKTIMAGLLIKELDIRSAADRVLVVAPGSLVEQWQDELARRFDLRLRHPHPGHDRGLPHRQPLHRAPPPDRPARPDRPQRSAPGASQGVRLGPGGGGRGPQDGRPLLREETGEDQALPGGEISGSPPANSCCSPPLPTTARTRTSTCSWPSWTPTASRGDSATAPHPTTRT